LEAWTRKLLLGIVLLFAGVLLACFMSSYFFFGILLVMASLVVLATLPKGAEELQQPAKMESIGVIALVGSMGLGFCSLFALAFSAVGGGYPNEGGYLFTFLIFPFSIGIFALLGLFLSIVVIRGVSSKKLWYVLMAYWIALVPFALFWSRLFFGFMLILIYPVLCIAYFLTDKPRQYFHLTAEEPVAQASESN
jgi:MFS family permease